jgi:hypothetical protein
MFKTHKLLEIRESVLPHIKKKIWLLVYDGHVKCPTVSHLYIDVPHFLKGRGY